MYGTSQNGRLADYRTSAYVRGQMGQVSSFSGRKPYYPTDEKPKGPSLLTRLKTGVLALINSSAASPSESTV